MRKLIIPKKMKMMTDNNYDSLLLEDLLDDIELSDAPKKITAISGRWVCSIA